MACTRKAIHNKENITDVHADGPLNFVVEHEITGHGFPVSVKGDTDQFRSGIHDRTAAVTAGNVVV